MQTVSPMRFKPLWLSIAAVLLIAGLETLQPALGASVCRIRVDTILAARNDAGVDPQLGAHIGELQAMFAYTSYRLLSSKSLVLETGQSGVVDLPDDRRLKITPQTVQGDRADIVLQMLRRKRTVFQTQIQLLNRGSLFVGGPEYRDGNLIFQISSSH